METQEIIGELYALRAGLSLIAQEKDKLDSEIADAEEKRDMAIAQARADADSVIRASEVECSRVTSYRESVKVRFEDAKDSYERNEREIKENCDSNESLAFFRRRRFCHIALGIIFIILHVATTILPYLIFSPFLLIPIIVIVLGSGIAKMVHTDEEPLDRFLVGLPYLIRTLLYTLTLLVRFIDGDDVWVFLRYSNLVLLIIAAIVCIALTIKWLVDTIDDDNSGIRRCKESIQEYRKAVAKQNELKKSLEDYEGKLREAKTGELEDHKAVVCEAEKIYNEKSTEANKRCSAACKASNEMYGTICTGIYETLVKTYSGLLDPRDWGILDLIIWQLETRRADTIKEALQLADRETQTDRIVSTMQSASAAIAQSLEDGFTNMRTQLNASFYTLTRGLARATDIISSEISQSSERLASRLDSGQQEVMLTTNRALERLASQSTLQTALLEKSNTSSKELVDSVKKMREKLS